MKIVRFLIPAILAGEGMGNYLLISIASKNKNLLFSSHFQTFISKKMSRKYLFNVQVYPCINQSACRFIVVSGCLDVIKSELFCYF